MPKAPVISLLRLEADMHWGAAAAFLGIRPQPQHHASVGTGAVHGAGPYTQAQSHLPFTIRLGWNTSQCLPSTLSHA